MSAELSYEKLLEIKKELGMLEPIPKCMKVHPILWLHLKLEIPEARHLKKSGDSILGLTIYIDPDCKEGWKLEY